MPKSIIHTNAAPAAVGPYSQAVVAPAGRRFEQRGCGSYHDGGPASGEWVGAVVGEAVEAVNAAHDDVVPGVVCGRACASSFADADEV